MHVAFPVARERAAGVQRSGEAHGGVDEFGACCASIPACLGQWPKQLAYGQQGLGALLKGGTVRGGVVPGQGVLGSERGSAQDPAGIVGESEPDESERLMIQPGLKCHERAIESAHSRIESCVK
jgi:hypothetical protein